MEPLIAPGDFSLHSSLQYADNGDGGACKDEVRWHGKLLRVEMRVDNEVEHLLNDIAGINDILNPVPPVIPEKCGLPLPGEVISHCHIKCRKKRVEEVLVHGHESKQVQSICMLAAKSNVLLSEVELGPLPAAYGGYAAKS